MLVAEPRRAHSPLMRNIVFEIEFSPSGGCSMRPVVRAVFATVALCVAPALAHAQARTAWKAPGEGTSLLRTPARLSVAEVSMGAALRALSESSGVPMAF